MEKADGAHELLDASSHRHTSADLINEICGHCVFARVGVEGEAIEELAVDHPAFGPAVVHLGPDRIRRFPLWVESVLH